MTRTKLNQRKQILINNQRDRRSIHKKYIRDTHSIDNGTITDGYQTQHSNRKYVREDLIDDLLVKKHIDRINGLLPRQVGIKRKTRDYNNYQKPEVIGYLSMLPYKSLIKHVLWLSKQQQQEEYASISLSKELEYFAAYVQVSISFSNI